MAKKTALITGGAIRIGASIATFLAQNGYDIAISYNSSEKQARQTREGILALGRKCEVFKYDLSKQTSYKKLIDDVFNKFPNTNVLINNASIFYPNTFLETTEEFFDENYNINLKAPFFLSKYFAQNIKDEGDIINILDTFITRTSEKFFAYLLTKKNLADLTKMMARTLAPQIKVNGICVGITQLSQITSDEYLNKRIGMLPKKHSVLLDEINFSVKQLLENKALFGNFLFIDNGESVI
jgi:pteridine reductase